MNTQEHRPTRPENATREAIKAVHEAEHWIDECTGGETAIALAVIAVAKTNLALEARLSELADHLRRKE